VGGGFLISWRKGGVGAHFKTLKKENKCPLLELQMPKHTLKTAQGSYLEVD
jgi:hypothetical protein